MGTEADIVCPLSHVLDSKQVQALSHTHSSTAGRSDSMP